MSEQHTNSLNGENNPFSEAHNGVRATEERIKELFDVKNPTYHLSIPHELQVDLKRKQEAYQDALAAFQNELEAHPGVHDFLQIAHIQYRSPTRRGVIERFGIEYHPQSEDEELTFWRSADPNNLTIVSDNTKQRLFEIQAEGMPDRIIVPHGTELRVRLVELNNPPSRENRYFVHPTATEQFLTQLERRTQPHS